MCLQVRGVTSISTEELRFILEACEASALVVQDAPTLERLLPELPVGCGGRNCLPARHRCCCHCCATVSIAAQQHNSPHYCLQDCCDLAVVLWGEVPSAAVELGHHQLLAVTFNDVIARGREAGATWQPPAQARQDVATLAFTSGTGGSPKVRPAPSLLASTPECGQHVIGAHLLLRQQLPDP